MRWWNQLVSVFFLAVLASRVLASPHVDVEGEVKALEDGIIIIETHGQWLEVPRSAFADKNDLSLGKIARARLEIEDLGRVKRRASAK